MFALSCGGLLNSADILKNICEQAYEGGYNSNSRATVAALSETCHALHRIASNVLWSRLFSLRPLVKCLPSDVWIQEGSNITDGHGAIALIRPPDPSEWTRFVANAVFVTSFKRFGPAPDLDDDTYRTICLYRPGPGPLLPNLRELIWEEADADVFEYGFQFLSPKLTTLHIGQPPSDSLLLPILRALDARSPQIRHLSVQCRSSVGPADPNVSKAVKHLLHLETIDLSLPLFDDALEHLATLSNLTVAKLFLPRDTQLHERLITSRAPIFPSLTVLHVTAIRLEPFITSLIDLISSSQLSEVRLSTAHDPSNVCLNRFLSAMSLSPSSDVISAVYLSFPIPSSIPLMRSLNATPPNDHPECTLDISAFKPILSCLELTDLDVTSFFLRLDDDFIRTLAAACPKLRSLRLMPPYYSGRFPEVTLDGLLPLFHLCLDLENLSLPINASEAPRDTAGCVHDPQLVMLDVGDSPIRFADEVAVFLSAHCAHPSFEIIAAQAHEGDSNPEHMRAREVHSAVWDQVARLVRLCAKVRSQERVNLCSGV